MFFADRRTWMAHAVAVLLIKTTCASVFYSSHCKDLTIDSLLEFPELSDYGMPGVWGGLV